MNFRTKLRNLIKARISDKVIIEMLLEELIDTTQEHAIDFEEWINEEVVIDEPTEVLYKKFLKDG